MPPLPAARACDLDLQRCEDGVGALFHRRYRVLIKDATRSPAQLIDELVADLNAAAPREIVVFAKQDHGPGLDVGDDVLIQLPGPWDGPVRVVARRPTCFRFVTHKGHVEAGRIEFRAGRLGHELGFEIESWARSGDRQADLLYDRVRLTQELQLYVWASYTCGRISASGRRPSPVA
ncbi:MAG: DUF1990 domain-containing protein [Actinomycetota bacterium]|nr:DUF1990 domain-containing protein [Actinomycetota bacterium]